ncbi:hypothetical protein D3C81_975140 [compost metagenome]
MLDGGQGRALVLADQCTFGDQRAADAPGNGRGHRGITQVQAGTLQRGLGFGDFGVGLQEAGSGIVVFLAAHGLVVDQLAVALLLQAGLIQGGLGLGQGGAGAVVVGLEGRRVDEEQHVALLDVTALTVHPLEYHTRHPCAHFGSTRGEDTAAEFAADGQRLQLQGFHAHLRRGHFFFLLGAVATAGQGQAQKRQKRHGAQARGEASRHTDLPMMTRCMLRQAFPRWLLIPVGRV